LPPAVRECSICLDAFVVGCSRKTLPCLHGFHEECIDRWLRTNGSCPICKHTVK
jgi:E3 ubiquitin-protein ligase SDIR1